MKNKEKAIFLSLAIFATICIGSLGIAVAERSIVIAVLAVIGVIFAMGMGFTIKKKLREAGEN